MVKKTMKRNQFIILIVIYIIGLPLILFVGSLLLFKHNQVNNTPPLPSITLAPTHIFPPPPTYAPVTPGETHKVYSLVSTNPTGGQKDVSPNLQTITLTFDKPVTAVSDI